MTMQASQALARAIRIAAEAFEKTIDKGGSPYILHCLAVMEGVRHLGCTAMTAGVLHDLLEDCPSWHAERLQQEGFSADAVALIELLTHRQDEEYASYIGRIAACPEAKAIKLADLMHNMNLTRLPGLSERALERLQKYHQAYHLLSAS
jgi:(p)ppGpp synthase/HD superfamily hydrolase